MNRLMITIIKTKTMITTKTFIVCMTVLTSFFFLPAEGAVRNRHKKKEVKTDTAVTKNKYDELLNKAKTAEGMIKIHTVGND